ncbi:hypothetical protein RHMOL_Rhmol01G0185000 [Rhododendron molle]|uniref:Uncharacterized protein n=1 Tax=Rhododendron molle TaxID=49168 RepID=A0ACC0Q2R7_RHOML|nr:hypothetical protein RHMOL_Rhmol01G0185000 [Rhododendron molle]
MEIEISGSSSPISCEVLDINGNYARHDCESHRKLEFKDDDDFFNTDVPIEEESEQDVLHNSLDATSDMNLLHSQIPPEAIPKLDMNLRQKRQFMNFIMLTRTKLVLVCVEADAKMMANYAHFGDVVSFDTTYRKNKDGRPFAMFVGVNYHKQTVVFGAVLLYSESADSFIWLFDTFAKAMGGKTPKTILTNPDAAMAKVLAAQWPETIHRLCIWHIYQNAASKLSGAFARFKDFSKDFNECIYDYEDEDEFISA